MIHKAVHIHISAIILRPMGLISPSTYVRRILMYNLVSKKDEYRNIMLINHQIKKTHQQKIKKAMIYLMPRGGRRGGQPLCYGGRKMLKRHVVWVTILLPELCVMLILCLLQSGAMIRNLNHSNMYLSHIALQVIYYWKCIWNWPFNNRTCQENCE